MKQRPVGLRCPGCGKRTIKTLDSRPAPGGIRRRKVCTSCDQRFNTFEEVRGLGRPRPDRRDRGGRA